MTILSLIGLIYVLWKWDRGSSYRVMSGVFVSQREAWTTLNADWLYPAVIVGLLALFSLVQRQTHNVGFSYVTLGFLALLISMAAAG